MRSTLIVSMVVCVASIFVSCSKDEPQIIPTPSVVPLNESQIVISNIVGVPEDIVFDNIKIEITGVDWSVIDAIEEPFINGVATITLPTDFASEDLCKMYRSDAFDYEGYWPAESVDNHNAKGAAIKDNNIFAYNGDERVGRILLTDWSGVGPAEDKYFVYFFYSDQPCALSGYNQTVNGNRKSLKYEVSFQAGWNAYANKKAKESDNPRPDLCTTTIPADIPLYWRFESYLY